ncbi:hypothetical protein M5121_06635 [Acinetobacter sp. ANC5681]|nr:hypothetical protein [Acinetobacter sp. ANC5681]
MSNLLGYADISHFSRAFKKVDKYDAK